MSFGSHFDVCTLYNVRLYIYLVPTRAVCSMHYVPILPYVCTVFISYIPVVSIFHDIYKRKKIRCIAKTLRRWRRGRKCTYLSEYRLLVW